MAAAAGAAMEDAGHAGQADVVDESHREQAVQEHRHAVVHDKGQVRDPVKIGGGIQRGDLLASPGPAFTIHAMQPAALALDAE